MHKSQKCDDPLFLMGHNDIVDNELCVAKSFRSNRKLNLAHFKSQSKNV